MAALQCDRGNWATWRNRGLTPPPLPPDWFRRATGQPLVYQLDHVRAWLASRRGEPYDALADWRACLLAEFGTEAPNAAEVRKLAAIYAQAIGPIVDDVRFTAPGFSAYVENLINR